MQNKRCVNAIFDAWSNYIGCSVRQSSHRSGSRALEDLSRFDPIIAKKERKTQKDSLPGRLLIFFLGSTLMLSESEVFTNKLSVWTAKWPIVSTTSNLWTNFCFPNSRPQNIHICKQLSIWTVQVHWSSVRALLKDWKSIRRASTAIS